MFYLEPIDEDDFPIVDFDLSNFVYTKPTLNALTLLDKLRIRHDPIFVMLASEFLRAVTEELNGTDSDSESDKSESETGSNTTTESLSEELSNPETLVIFKLDD